MDSIRFKFLINPEKFKQSGRGLMKKENPLQMVINDNESHFERMFITVFFWVQEMCSLWLMPHEIAPRQFRLETILIERFYLFFFHPIESEDRRPFHSEERKRQKNDTLFNEMLVLLMKKTRHVHFLFTNKSIISILIFN